MEIGFACLLNLIFIKIYYIEVSFQDYPLNENLEAEVCE